MSNPFNGPVSRLWVSWKSLSLPWRKQRLAGYDLNGNTFWEFKDTVRSERWRRIARQPRHKDYADIHISPQWHQWLRHTRPEPPSIAEQQANIQRQREIKELAQLADARWNSQKSYLNSPKAASIGNVGGVRGRGEDAEKGEEGRLSGVETEQDLSTQMRTGEQAEGSRLYQKKRREDWEAGDRKWQPEPWSPGARNSGAG